MKDHDQVVNMTRFHCPKMKTLCLALFSWFAYFQPVSPWLRSGENLGKKLPEWGLQLSFGRPKSPSVTSGSSWICLNQPWGTVEGGNPGGVAAEDSGVPCTSCRIWSPPTRMQEVLNYNRDMIKYLCSCIPHAILYRSGRSFHRWSIYWESITARHIQCVLLLLLWSWRNLS